MYDTVLDLDRVVCVAQQGSFPHWLQAVVAVVALLLVAILGAIFLLITNRAWQQMQFKTKYMRR
jgi:hypothetical protein